MVLPGKAVYAFPRGCFFKVDHDEQWCSTVFPDRAEAKGAVDDQAGVRDLAARLGLDLWTRVWQHEFIHTWLAEQMGLPHSPTLRAVADGWTPPPDGNGIRNEEAMTEAVHHLYVNGNLPALEKAFLSPTWSGHSWDDLTPGDTRV